jgi:hypothetical protein
MSYIIAQAPKNCAQALYVSEVEYGYSHGAWVRCEWSDDLKQAKQFDKEEMDYIKQILKRRGFPMSTIYALRT